MLSSLTLKVPESVSAEDMLFFWIESYHELDRKYQALKKLVASCRNCSNDFVHLEELPTAKPTKDEVDVDELSQDPLEKLKLDEILLVMKNLTAKELLDAMKVSKGWKKLIESQSTLMNRAMREIVMKPNLNNCSLPLITKTFSNPRPYKHLKTSFIITTCFKYFKQLEPVQNYAESLETLEIDDSASTMDETKIPSHLDTSRVEMKSCVFPKLRMLKYRGEYFERLANFSFPALTHLLIELEDSDWEAQVFAITKIQKILQNMPHLRFLIAKFSDFDGEQESTSRNQPNLIQISLPFYYQNFMSRHVSLQVLEVNVLDMDQLSLLLNSLIFLKSLTIGRIDLNGDINFKDNRSIEIFKLIQYLSEDTRLNEVLRFFLSSLKSLTKLVLFHASNEALIRFAATNLNTLQQYICKEITEEAMIVYLEVRRNPFHQYENSTFELIAEPNHVFKEIEKSFV